jgi:hypothetical protein
MIVNRNLGFATIKHVRCSALALICSLATVQVCSAQENDKQAFHSHLAVAPGETVVVRGFNGSMDASSSETDALQVDARKIGPAGAVERVKIAVLENAEGILICALADIQEPKLISSLERATGFTLAISRSRFSRAGSLFSATPW